MEEKKSSSTVPIVLMILAVPVLYVASVGPVARMVGAPTPLLRAFYAPLIFLVERFDWFGRLMEGYLHLWGAQ